MNLFRTWVATAVVVVALTGLFVLPSPAPADGPRYVSPGAGFTPPRTMAAPTAEVYVHILSWTNTTTGRWGTKLYNVTQFSNGFIDWGGLDNDINFMLNCRDWSFIYSTSRLYRLRTIYSR